MWSNTQRGQSNLKRKASPFLVNCHQAWIYLHLTACASWIHFWAHFSNISSKYWFICSCVKYSFFDRGIIQDGRHNCQQLTWFFKLQNSACFSLFTYLCELYIWDLACWLDYTSNLQTSQTAVGQLKYTDFCPMKKITKLKKYTVHKGMAVLLSNPHLLNLFPCNVIQIRCWFKKYCNCKRKGPEDSFHIYPHSFTFLIKCLGNACRIRKPNALRCECNCKSYTGKG